MSRATQSIFGLAGVVLPFAGSVAPDGWMLCYGQAVSRTAYAHLFAVIGTTYGAGDGSTTFNLPDLRGRVPAGKDNMGGTAASRLASSVSGSTLGAVGGSETTVLTTAHMPAHSHGVNDPGHAHGVSDPGHAHGVTDPGHFHAYDRITASQPSGSGVSNTTSTTNNATTNTGAKTTGISINGAATGIAVVGAATGISTQIAGSGSAHNITQPTIVLNHIIKT